MAESESESESASEPQSEAEPSRRTIYLGRKVDLALQAVPLADGREALREVVLHPGAVALLALVDGDRLCLVNNQRHAVGETLLEVPAGTLDPGETPEETAARELREETGYTAGRLSRVAEWFVSPGVLSERMVLFLAEELRAGPTSHQPDERIEPVLVPRAEALAMALDGRIRDAKTMLALLLLERLRPFSPGGGCNAPDEDPTAASRPAPLTDRRSG